MFVATDGTEEQLSCEHDANPHQRLQGVSIAMTFRFLMTRKESFGFQLAYARDKIAGMTQTQLATAVNRALGQVNRRLVMQWESNERLDLVTSQIVDAIVSVIGSSARYDNSMQNILRKELETALISSRSHAASIVRKPRSENPSVSFGARLASLREDVMQITQTALSERLSAAAGVEVRTICFEDIVEIEHGRIPSREVLDALLDVLLESKIDPERLQSLKSAGESLINNAHADRPLEQVDTAKLRIRATEILLGHDRTSASSSARSLTWNLRRSYKGIEAVTGISDSLLSNIFTSGKQTALSPDCLQRLMQYLNDQDVPPTEIQEFELICNEMQFRRTTKVGKAR